MPHIQPRENRISGTTEPELVDIGSYADQIVEELRLDLEMPLVKVEERLDDRRVGVVLFDRENPGFKYDFYVRNRADALDWISHLAEKRWVTTKHLQLLAALAKREFQDNWESHPSEWESV
ncbi:hypothetical protein [Pseudoxanthomonas sp. X-1]|uniref:hypothetical protein n=1 Tax=Pseudoxanthomonas sp. X-1 TaxID=2571115 RepID=UPI00110A2E4F|nr:hypothetical protein [Pseudoxanthomonas sp. X-1]TMN24519.1 hypothetical protein FF950_05415 [Pseudoxanthomonas sp. X-1]UAY75214.1 hypothetical protein LAJ50_02815 [Pseudoxanthomonas sp. X-1]